MQKQRPLHPMQQQQQQQQQKYYYESITTVGSMLRLSPIALLRALDPLLTFQECCEFHRRVCLATAPKAVAALTLLQRQKQNPQHFILPTGVRKLDAHLRGGFRVGALTEVVGCAGAAKTQLALQMACYCRASTIFVDTESKVSLQRLQEMAGSSHILSNVSLHAPTNLAELLHVLGQLDDEILNHTETTGLPVKLLVIDSIAAPARRHGFGSAAVQAATILRIAQTVKRLADQFQLVALVINQVASSPSSTEQTTRAALGTAWHHCVSTRVQLEMTMDPQGAIIARQATVVKSNMVGASPPLEFKVTTQGLVDV